MGRRTEANRSVGQWNLTADVSPMSVSVRQTDETACMHACMMLLFGEIALKRRQQERMCGRGRTVA